MIKVDPKLFVTCRLCLEDTGMYQITQVVQQKIKYCFDIDVDQYDGLPQLVCGQCEKILSKFHTKKRIFIEKQYALIANLHVRKEIEGSLCSSPPHETVTSSFQYDKEEQNTRRKSISKTKKRKTRIISSSSSSTHDSRGASSSPILNSDYLTTETKRKCYKRRSKCREESWEANHIKKYACKLCNKRLKFGEGFTNHLKTHSDLLSMYPDIFKRTCTVKLIKIDGKPNPTGSNNTVFLSQNRIIGPQNGNVYVLYLTQDDTENTEPVKSNDLESDDADEIIAKSKCVKRRRLISRSSTDTSDIESGRKCAASKAAHLEEINCINIDDTSNESHQSDGESTNDEDSVPVKRKDIDPVRNNKKVCHNKYITRRQDIETDRKKAGNSSPYLKHKLHSKGQHFLKNYYTQVEKPVPRINVKPNSELLSERILKNLYEQPAHDNVWVPGASTPTRSAGLNMANIASVSLAQVPPNLYANPNALSVAPAMVQEVCGWLVWKNRNNFQ